MTTKFLDMTGKTEDEAIAKALAQLGLDRDEVSVEILERAKKGFLGIGAAQAKVRVTYEVPDGPVQPVMKPTVPPPPPPPPPPAPPRGPGGGPRPAAAPRRPPGAEEGPPYPQAGAGGGGPRGSGGAPRPAAGGPGRALRG